MRKFFPIILLFFTALARLDAQSYEKDFTSEKHRNMYFESKNQKKDINKRATELAQQQNKELFLPKDEFETTAEYN